MLLDPALLTPDDPFYRQADYEEGLFIDYKLFQAQNTTPQFAFGYELTYTTFKYSSLTFWSSSNSLSFLPPEHGSYMSNPAPEGGLESL
ncbi:hypothetical protein AUEXF2481DRAFT_432100 [Aureobasidium subglaciale EXF-2481]|uniref:beta-glucosidase n=1 Tax=Aureobasidium subglaciale (strain EXF-2481) TaxID=1043005 RepID=A0A074YDH9_AURSE|nr:uncharacterized protein AUEXF2481DRAFT_432100 [Aureobasidium subglaciale EXF-2481]KEQ92122.1 hypothetical protein AUEXF2481DRAFT_432100 [Aureobasidium subglaciale EXF-2481]